METELFVHFAEIAGVFVGFGALIALRSEHREDLHDVVYLRGVLMAGVWVVIAALMAITISRFGVRDHTLWLVCAAAAFVFWAIGVIALNLTGDAKALNRSPELVDRVFPVIGLPLHVTLGVSLLLIVFGVWPGLEEALYVTSLTAGVVFGGYTLLVLALSRNHAIAPGVTADSDASREEPTAVDDHARAVHLG